MIVQLKHDGYLAECEALVVSTGRAYSTRASIAAWQVRVECRVQTLPSAPVRRYVLEETTLNDPSQQLLTIVMESLKAAIAKARGERL